MSLVTSDEDSDVLQEYPCNECTDFYSLTFEDLLEHRKIAHSKPKKGAKKVKVKREKEAETIKEVQAMVEVPRSIKAEDIKRETQATPSTSTGASSHFGDHPQGRMTVRTMNSEYIKEVIEMYFI